MAKDELSFLMAGNIRANGQKESRKELVIRKIVRRALLGRGSGFKGSWLNGSMTTRIKRTKQNLNDEIKFVIL